MKQNAGRQPDAKKLKRTKGRQPRMRRNKEKGELIHDYKNREDVGNVFL